MSKYNIYIQYIIFFFNFDKKMNDKYNRISSLCIRIIRNYGNKKKSLCIHLNNFIINPYFFIMDRKEIEMNKYYKNKNKTK